MEKKPGKLAAFMKRTGHTMSEIGRKIREMPLKQKVLIGAGVALTGVAGYMAYKFAFKKFDGVTYRLRAFTKSKETANEMKEVLMEQGFHVRVVRSVIHSNVMHRIYIHKPKA